MNIEQCIKDLLYRNDCVIIPGFGAILSQRISAQIIEETNTFLPPNKELSFNARLERNDGLLVNYFSNSNNVSYNEALHTIEEFVKSLISQLNNSNKINFEGIGVFKFNEEKNITFTPDANSNFLTYSFGLGEFNSNLIGRETPLSTEEFIDEEEHDSPLDDSKVIKLNKNKYYKYAASGLILLALGSAIGSRTYMKSVEEHNFITYNEANRKVNEQIQQATFVISDPLPTVKLIMTEKDKETTEYAPFKIVAGAFQDENNAIKKVNSLINQGYSNAKIIGTNKFGLHQVIFNEYATRVEAKANLSIIKKSNEKGAWILFKQ
jgi:hypothetical protein